VLSLEAALASQGPMGALALLPLVTRAKELQRDVKAFAKANHAEREQLGECS